MKKFFPRVSSTSTKFLQDQSIGLLDAGISNAQKKLLSVKIEEHGGKSKIITKNSDLEDISLLSCQDELKFNDIHQFFEKKNLERLQQIELVQIQWLQQCFQHNSCVPKEQYCIQPNIIIQDSATKTSKKRNPMNNTPISNKKNKSNSCSPQWDKWETVDKPGKLFIWNPPQVHSSSSKILAFDMDGTLIQTKSGKRFPIDQHDWKLFSNSIPQILQDKIAEGYKLILLTNQNGIEKGKVKASEIQEKILALSKAVGVPFLAYVTISNDIMRKPRIGAWEYMIAHHNNNIVPNLEQCLFVGDAAGRPKTKTTKKDFSSGDLKWALNIGIPFNTPEQFFLHSKENIHCDRSLADLGTMDPRTLICSTIPPKLPKEQEILVLVGPPASGKSTFCKLHLPTYECINQDTLKTPAACIKSCKDSLNQGKSVVIDNTNRSKSSRKTWISIAQDLKLPIRCIHFQMTKDVAFHLNEYRHLQNGRSVPVIAIHGYFKNFEDPTVQEGFQHIEQRNFNIDNNLASPLLTSFLLP